MSKRSLARRIMINMLIGATMFLGFSFAVNMTFAGNTRDFGTNIIRSTQIMCVKQKRSEIPTQVPDFACKVNQYLYNMLKKLNGE